jgi:ABC-2 type transport system permease protein
VNELAAAHGWRTATITALGDWVSSGRIAGHAIRLFIQLTLVVFLWRALYAHTGSAAGLTEAMAVSYAVLAVLMLRIHRSDRFAARDTVIQHIRYGTIIYWYLRPLSPQRYNLWRGIGDQAYGFLWAVAGYLGCLAAGAVTLPVSPGAAAALSSGAADRSDVLLGRQEYVGDINSDVRAEPTVRRLCGALVLSWMVSGG